MGRKPRKHTPEFKFRVVLEVITGAKRPVEVCREHRITDGTLHRWRKEFMERGPQIYESDRQDLEKNERIVELERMVGRLAMELEASKKASSWLLSLQDGDEE